MGLKLVTDDKPVKVYRQDKVSKAGNDYSRYSLRVSSKDINDNWQSGFVDVQFKKGVSVDNKAEISIKNAFPIVNEYNGNTTIKWLITDFDVITPGLSSGLITDANGFINVPDGDQEELPFY